jgi:hypothetical protein
MFRGAVSRCPRLGKDLTVRPQDRGAPFNIRFNVESSCSSAAFMSSRARQQSGNIAKLPTAMRRSG